MQIRISIVLAVLAAALSAGCGRDRVEPPDPTRPADVVGQAERTYPAVGVRFEGPDDWTWETGKAPLVTSTANGTATVAVWRYERTEPLPREDADLDEAERRLIEAAKLRDPRFRLDRARRLEVDGAPAIQILGTQLVDGRERRVRSTHAYAKGAEFVVDAYAAPRDFAAVDRSVFRPLVRSFKIDPPQG